MELINATRMIVAYIMGMEPSGRELLVVVVKGTFDLPRTPDQPLYLAAEQVPLVMADTFTGEPGFSAPLSEVDFAPRKPRGEVLLVGSAHAPEGRPATRIPVGMRVGNVEKTFAVVGDRCWQAGLRSISASAPEPFLVKPISYDCAFGGTDAHGDDTSKHSAFMRNPVGTGYHRQLKREWVDGTPLPNTEELKRPIVKPDDDYVPMAFGPLGRGWEPRYLHAGTYDQAWIDDHFPFLPPDFDEQYYQSAARDQQLDSPLTGQQITLLNLTPDGRRSFSLPHFAAPVHIFPKRGGHEDLTANLDTVVLEPDAERLTLTWRVARPLKKNMFEIAQVLIGKKTRGWWRARELGKTYYPSLAELTRQRKEAAEAIE